MIVEHERTSVFILPKLLIKSISKRDYLTISDGWMIARSRKLRSDITERYSLFLSLRRRVVFW